MTRILWPPREGCAFHPEAGGEQVLRKGGDALLASLQHADAFVGGGGPMSSQC